MLHKVKRKWEWMWHVWTLQIIRESVHITNYRDSGQRANYYEPIRTGGQTEARCHLGIWSTSSTTSTGSTSTSTSSSTISTRQHQYHQLIRTSGQTEARCHLLIRPTTTLEITQYPPVQTTSSCSSVLCTTHMHTQHVVFKDKFIEYQVWVLRLPHTI